MRDTARPLDYAGAPAALTAAVLGAFTVLLVRTAWLCDDAYITFRTVDNLVHGFGLRWNVVERVQSFTHPLWLAVFAVPYAATHEAYFTALATTSALSVATVWLVLRRAATTPAVACLAGVALLCSKAFVEFSTAGLENPLTHVLLVLMLLAATRVERDGRGLTRLWTLGSLVLLTRLDLALLVGPLLVERSAGVPLRRAVRAVVAGLLPLAAWEVFSVVYYGVPFPNTAYAKLQTGIAARDLAWQGLQYLWRNVQIDPVTLPAAAAATLLLAWKGGRRGVVVAVGVACYLAYLVRIGGDFMVGRFLTAPLVFAVAAWSGEAWNCGVRTVSAAAAVLAGLGVGATTHPPLLSSRSLSSTPAEVNSGIGVADERAYYFPFTGLLNYAREHPLPSGIWVDQGVRLRTEGRRVATARNVGFAGYFAGPTVTIIDRLALNDALLARLPAKPGWRIGHFERSLPAGYLATVQSGTNQLEDPDIALLYERLRLATQAPIWSRRRWRAIAVLNLGTHD